MTSSEKSVTRKRSRAQKVGRIKYNQQLLKRALREIQDVKLMLRTIFKGLRDSFHFEKPLIEKICCKDEIDTEILQVLYEAGPGGIFPRDIAKRLRRFRLDRFKVSRRIESMNKKLKKEIGQTVAEKRGWKTALTDFAYEIWGDAEQEYMTRLDTES